MLYDLYPDSDLLEAIELIQDNGNLIFNFKFITIAWGKMGLPKHPLWIAFPTQMFIGFGIGFGLMTFMNLVEVEGKTKPDGTRKVTSFYRLQARRNPDHYLGTIYQF